MTHRHPSGYALGSNLIRGSNQSARGGLNDPQMVQSNQRTKIGPPNTGKGKEAIPPVGQGDPFQQEVGYVSWSDDDPDMQDYNDNSHWDPSGPSGGQHQYPKFGTQKSPTLGEVIDGFRQLSDEDKSIFMMVIGQSQSVPIAPFATNVTAAWTAGPIQVPTGNPVPAQAGRPGPIPGTTVNPQSGKVYRIQPPKERSEELRGLQVDYDRARQALADYMSANNLIFDVGSKQTYDGQDQVVQPNEELVGLRRTLDAAKTALKDYKQVHAEQFAQIRTQRVRTVPTRGVPRGRGARGGRGG